MAKKDRGDGVLASNRAARHEFVILESFEAGVELAGTEVKALRAGHGHIREAYVRVEGGELWLIGAHIGEYEMGNRQNHPANRRRKLLVHRREIIYLDQQVRQGGLTMVPLQLYLKGNHIKCEIALVRGKKLWDKRESIKARDAQREAQQAMGRALKGG